MDIFYEQTISLPLSSPVRLADIRSIDIAKTTRATFAGVDLWDLDMVDVKAYGGGVPPRLLFFGQGTPLMRFTEQSNLKRCWNRLSQRGACPDPSTDVQNARL